MKKQDDLLDVKLRVSSGSEMCEVVAAFFLGKSVDNMRKYRFISGKQFHSV